MGYRRTASSRPRRRNDDDFMLRPKLIPYRRTFHRIPSSLIVIRIMYHRLNKRASSQRMEVCHILDGMHREYRIDSEVMFNLVRRTKPLTMKNRFSLFPYSNFFVYEACPYGGSEYGIIYRYD